LNLHLHESLSEMLAKYPPRMHSRRSAINDLLATTIEISLIKLSLVRARAHQALYSYASPTAPQSDMTSALSSAFTKLKGDERRLEEEERVLDNCLSEYASMLKLVDGERGGFAQIVEDWTKVRREQEECRRDLQRLGWTGD
jgi:hypothetical protein